MIKTLYALTLVCAICLLSFSCESQDAKITSSLIGVWEFDYEVRDSNDALQMALKATQEFRPDGILITEDKTYRDGQWEGPFVTKEKWSISSNTLKTLMLESTDPSAPIGETDSVRIKLVDNSRLITLTSRGRQITRTRKAEQDVDGQPEER